MAARTFREDDEHYFVFLKYDLFYQLLQKVCCDHYPNVGSTEKDMHQYNLSRLILSKDTMDSRHGREIKSQVFIDALELELKTSWDTLQGILQDCLHNLCGEQMHPTELIKIVQVSEPLMYE